MKLLGKIFIFLLVVLIGLVLARNVIVKTALERGVTAATGMPLSIKKFDLNILNTSIDIEGLMVRNPAGFHDTVLAEIPKILVAYQRGAIFTGKIHFKAMEFDLKQFNVVKNEQGILNLDKLKALQAQPNAEEPSDPAPKTEGKVAPLQIDSFRLKVGKASFIDYAGGQASVKDFNVGLDETYTNVTDPNKLVMLIVFKIMTRTPLALVPNFNVGALQGSVSGILGSATDVAGQMATKGLDTLKDAQRQAGDTPKGVAGVVEEKTKGLAGSVKGAASDLKKKIKLPF